jgi:hypothetical protein
MDLLFKTKENTKQEYLHDNKEIGLQVLQASNTDCKRNINMITSISNLDLHMLIIAISCMLCVYCIYPNTRQDFLPVSALNKLGIILNLHTKKNTSAESVFLHHIICITSAFCTWEAWSHVLLALCLHNNCNRYKLVSCFIHCAHATVTFAFCMWEAGSCVSLIICLFKDMHTTWLH